MAEDESTRTRRRRNWKRGMFRLWAVCAVGWMVVMGWMVTVDWWADAHDPLANAVLRDFADRVATLPPGFTLDQTFRLAEDKRQMLSDYLALPPAERAKVVSSLNAPTFLDHFAGLPLAEQAKFLNDLNPPLDPPPPQAFERARRKALYGWLVQSGTRLVVPPLLVLAGGVGLWWAGSWVVAGFRKGT